MHLEVLPPLSLHLCRNRVVSSSGTKFYTIVFSDVDFLERL